MVTQSPGQAVPGPEIPAEVRPDPVRQWTITVTTPCDWLTANDRRNRMVQANLVKMWREAAYWAARKAKLPTGLQRVRLDVEAVFFGRAPVRDRDNLRPTVKAAIDGAIGPAREWTRNGKRHRSVGYGVVPDDSDKHVDGPYLTIGPGKPARLYGPGGELTITITEVSGEQS